MKARTSVLIVFVAAIFVLATVSHAYAAQTTTEQERAAQRNQVGGQTNPQNDAGAQGETPRMGNLQTPVIVKHVGWSWLFVTGLIGYLLGRITSRPRHLQGRDEDIRRDRTA